MLVYVLSIWLHRLFGEVFTETVQALERRVHKLEEVVVCVAAAERCSSTHRPPQQKVVRGEKRRSSSVRSCTHSPPQQSRGVAAVGRKGAATGCAGYSPP